MEKSRPPRGVTPMEEDISWPDERAGAVQRVLAKHLPPAVDHFEDFGVRHNWHYFWANRLISADRSAYEQFGVSDNLEEVEELLRATRVLSSRVNSLKPEIRRSIELRKPTQSTNKTRKFEPALTSIKEELAYFEGLITSYQQTISGHKKADKRRNWRAVSVAEQAVEIWNIAHRKEFCTKRMQNPENMAIDEPMQIDRVAPRHEKHDAPGPFGRFLEEVFAALGIFARNGEPVSAATALDSLKALEK